MLPNLMEHLFSLFFLYPANGKTITHVTAAGRQDVEKAVAAAKQAYKTSWGKRCSGTQRSHLLNKLADLVEANMDELAALEALDSGKFP
jgi:aldehyde dehydrogenase (NAD+)